MAIKTAKMCEISEDHARAKAFLAARDGNLATLNSVLENVSESRKREILSKVVQQYNQISNPLILAAAKNHYSIVELLGRKYRRHCDINKGGTVYLRDRLRHNVSALCCATSHGNMEMVKLFVEELGANVNHRSEYNITPIRDACSTGHVHVVAYLAHHGADLFLRHAYDQSTCLIEAIRNGHFDVAEFLLKEGLDCNIPTSDTGMTALHFACRQQSTDLVNCLLGQGALKDIKDMRGLTPLDHACETCNEKICELFLDGGKVALSKEDKIRTHELLGAANIINGNHIMGFFYVKQGMRLRFSDPEDIRYKSGLVMVENDSLVYGNRRESFTIDELEELETDEDGQTKEAILIMERILGKHKFLCPEVVIRDFCGTATIYEGEGIYMDALTMLMKVLKIRGKTRKSNWQIVEHFTILFAQMQHISYILDPNVVIQVFDQCLTDIEQDWLKYQYVDYDLVSEDSMENVSKQVRNVFNLIAVMKYLIKEEGEGYLDIVLARFVSRFLDIDIYIDAIGKASPLHIACTGVSSRLPQLRSPNIDVIELLLAKGADINATDRDGNTPLHVLASYNGSDDKVIFHVTGLFIQSGAHLDAKNNEGLRPLDLANPVVVDELKEHTKKVPLKCMAAQVVKLHLKNYDELLPCSLCKFVEQH